MDWEKKIYRNFKNLQTKTLRISFFCQSISTAARYLGLMSRKRHGGSFNFDAVTFNDEEDHLGKLDANTDATFKYLLFDANLLLLIWQADEPTR